MPTNEELEAFQKSLDNEEAFRNNLMNKEGMKDKGNFSELGLQGSGAFHILKSPNLDESDGSFDDGKYFEE